MDLIVGTLEPLNGLSSGTQERELPGVGMAKSCSCGTVLIKKKWDVLQSKLWNCREVGLS